MPDLSARLAGHGVTRREFLSFCATLAVSLGLAEASAPRVAAALERGAKLAPAVWLNLGSCTGCTESLAQAQYPDVATVVLDLLSLNYMETLSAAAGAQTEAALAATIEHGGHIAIVEGAVMTGQDGNTLRIAGRTGDDILAEVVRDAALVIAVGSCAVDGGWVAAEPNPAGATGVLNHLPHVRERLVNLPTCPVNPTWVVTLVAAHLMGVALPEMDAERRPTQFFGQTIHDGCPRRGHYSNGEFVEVFGGPEEQLGWCLYKLGCKGPTTFTDCPRVRWNRAVSWCVEAGSPCIGCGSLNWVDANAPFFGRTTAVTPGIFGLTPEEIGGAVAATALTGFAAWGVAETARNAHDEPDGEDGSS